MAEVRRLLRAVGEEQGMVVLLAQEDMVADEEQGLSSHLLGE
jgi:hypothetical protein